MRIPGEFRGQIVSDEMSGILGQMETGSVHHNRIFDFIPREWLTRHLEAAEATGGMSLRLLDLQGETVFVASGPFCSMGGDGGAGAEEAWPLVGDVLREELTELITPGGYILMAVPVTHREQRLGWLAACVPGGDEARHAQARSLLSLSASLMESLSESGYEVESLTGEVVRLYEELALIYGLTGRLGTESRIDEIFHVVIDEVVKILHPTDVVLQLADEEHGVLRTVFASGVHRDESLAFAPGLEDGVIGRALAGHHSILVSDLSREQQEPPWPFPVQRLLVVPLVADNKGFGVIFATDKLDGCNFDSREEKLFSAISSVAAIAIKNAQLYGDIKKLFEGFINASVTAVESRDPTTAGHSNRVAVMTVELAKFVTDSDQAPFKNVFYTGDQLLEISYAGLLHDFGKIGVRESVLLKEAKLFQGDMERIRGRFDYIGEKKTREALEKKLEILLTQGKEAYSRAVGAIDEELGREIARLEQILKMLQVMNDPRVLLSELPELEALDSLTENYYTDPRGRENPFLTPFEFHNLQILRGSLNDEERREIESHVTHSFNFLSKIPWGKSFPRIAEIVYAHHEKLDGSGYPRRLKAKEIPFQARMMTVADIFDALTAWDRPYKKAVSVEKALFILEMEAKEGKLDTHLVQLFRDAKVYKAVEGLYSR